MISKPLIPLLAASLIVLLTACDADNAQDQDMPAIEVNVETQTGQRPKTDIESARDGNN